MNLQVLVVESEPEELIFLEDALREIEDEGWLRDWASLQLSSAATCADAEQALSTGSPHVVLLNPDLPDGQGAGTFRRLQAAAPEIPMILLVNPTDHSLGVKLMREGAQDFLIRKQLDCAPLAHALRNAVTRHRVLCAARAASFIDALTGLPNRASFLASASRDLKLAERLERRWMLLIAEPKNLSEIATSCGEERRDMELVEAADGLRAICGPAEMISRIDALRFVITVFDSELETLEEAWMRIRTAASLRRMDLGASIFDYQRPVSLEAMIERAEQDLVPLPRPA
jgi:PleD family two-component response regulator